MNTRPSHIAVLLLFTMGILGACKAEIVPPFEDLEGVKSSYLIEELHQAGYVVGCNYDPPMFCPDPPLTRGETAVLIVRMYSGVDYQPPKPTGRFDDVPIDSWMAPWVESAYTLELLDPCKLHFFCPLDPPTRADVARLLALAMRIE